MVVVIKSSTTWYVMPCCPLKVNRHFQGTCHLYLQQETGMKQATRKAFNKLQDYVMQTFCSSNVFPSTSTLKVFTHTCNKFNEIFSQSPCQLLCTTLPTLNKALYTTVVKLLVTTLEPVTNIKSLSSLNFSHIQEDRN
jgi:hypothetical protein